MKINNSTPINLTSNEDIAQTTASDEAAKPAMSRGLALNQYDDEPLDAQPGHTDESGFDLVRKIEDGLMHASFTAVEVGLAAAVTIAPKATDAVTRHIFSENKELPGLGDLVPNEFKSFPALYRGFFDIKSSDSDR